VDEKAIRRAALITLRRAICERFPLGPERRAWLRWAVRAANSQRQPLLSPYIATTTWCSQPAQDNP
jgi:hypothetical protein